MRLNKTKTVIIALLGVLLPSFIYAETLQPKRETPTNAIISVDAYCLAHESIMEIAEVHAKKTFKDAKLYWEELVKNKSCFNVPEGKSFINTRRYDCVLVENKENETLEHIVCSLEMWDLDGKSYFYPYVETNKVEDKKEKI